MLRAENFKEQERHVKLYEERIKRGLREATPPTVLSNGWTNYTRENTTMSEMRPMTVVPRPTPKPMTPANYAMHNTRKKQWAKDLKCNGLDRDLPRQTAKLNIDLELAAIGAKGRRWMDEGGYRWANRTPVDPLPSYTETMRMPLIPPTAMETAKKLTKRLPKRHRRALHSTLDNYIEQQASNGLEIQPLDASAHHRYLAAAVLPQHLATATSDDPRQDDFPRLYRATPPPTFCHQLGNPEYKLKCDDLHRFCGCRARSGVIQPGASFFGLRPRTTTPTNELASITERHKGAPTFAYNTSEESAKQLAEFFKTIQ
jgi:hypothetical protein